MARTDWDYRPFLCSLATSGTFCIGIAKARVIYEGI
jgi:hypothetical protein